MNNIIGTDSPDILDGTDGADFISGLGGADNRFTFVGDTDFGGTAGELHYEFVGANTIISGDTDGDGNAEFAIRVDGNVSFASTDFLL